MTLAAALGFGIPAFVIWLVSLIWQTRKFSDDTYAMPKEAVGLWVPPFNESRMAFASQVYSMTALAGLAFAPANRITMVDPTFYAAVRALLFRFDLGIKMHVMGMEVELFFFQFWTVIAALLATTIAVLCQLRARGSISPFLQFIAKLLTDFFYVPVLEKLLSMLDCTRNVLDSAPSMVCWESDHMAREFSEPTDITPRKRCA